MNETRSETDHGEERQGQAVTAEQLHDVYSAGTSDGILQHAEETVQVDASGEAEPLERQGASRE